MKKLIVLLLLINGFSSHSQQQLINIGGWNTYVYAPQSKVLSPIILAFHGQGQMGTNINMLLTDGLPKLINGGFVPPKSVFIITPQGQWGGWDGAGTRTLLQKIKQQYPLADTNRVYLTGFSAGGKTAFEGVYIKPKALITFATAGTTDPQLKIITDNRIPTFMYVGQNDNQFYGITTWAATKINQVVPKLATLTIIPNTGHGGWNEKYISKEFWDLIEAAPPVKKVVDTTFSGLTFKLPSGNWKVISTPKMTSKLYSITNGVLQTMVDGLYVLEGDNYNLNLTLKKVVVPIVIPKECMRVTVNGAGIVLYDNYRYSGKAINLMISCDNKILTLNSNYTWEIK